MYQVRRQQNKKTKKYIYKWVKDEEDEVKYKDEADEAFRVRLEKGEDEDEDYDEPEVLEFTPSFGRTRKMMKVKVEVMIRLASKNYWKGAALTESLVLIFLYFAAYLTGVGALLERLSPSDDTVGSWSFMG